ncbi:MAG: hypothetical protein OSA79_02230 [Candidatus Thioglobus sp.]|nr:hypothetical protein [Candidatus Thioglobus sp.]
MNQTKIFYLLSLIVVFFIGHFYSQFNVMPVKPEIITINNDDEVKKQKSNILSLQLQLEELNNQLIFSLDELKITSQKLNLSLSKIQVLEEQLSSTKNAFNLSVLSLKSSNAKILENEKTLKELKKALSDAELDIELIKFDLEIAEANLRAN